MFTEDSCWALFGLFLAVISISIGNSDMAIGSVICVATSRIITAIKAGK